MHFIVKLQQGGNDRQIEYLLALLAARRFSDKNSHADSDVACRHFLVGLKFFDVSLTYPFFKDTRKAEKILPHLYPI